MKDNYDFSKGKKNPYADALKTRYTVTVHYDFTGDEGKDTGEQDPKGAGAETHPPQKQA